MKQQETMEELTEIAKKAIHNVATILPDIEQCSNPRRQYFKTLSELFQSMANSEG